MGRDGSNIFKGSKSENGSGFDGAGAPKVGIKMKLLIHIEHLSDVMEDMRRTGNKIIDIEFKEDNLVQITI